MRPLRVLFVLASILLIAASASAAPYYYVDWLSAESTGARPPAPSRCPTHQWSTSDFKRSRLLAGPEIWDPPPDRLRNQLLDPSTPYVSAQVSNAPPACDIVSLIGGLNQTYIVTLSEPIKDPIMAVLSLGQPGVFTTYDFDAPFDIVSQGTGFWGGNASSLAELPGDILRGNEGHGTLQFIGTFSTFRGLFQRQKTGTASLSGSARPNASNRIRQPFLSQRRFCCWSGDLRQVACARDSHANDRSSAIGGAASIRMWLRVLLSPQSALPLYFQLFTVRLFTFRLTRRPGERSSGEQMKVDVEDGLAGFAIGIEDRAEPSLGVPAVLGDGRRAAEHGADERIVLRGEIVQ